MTKVFITYSGKYVKLALEVTQQLRSAGFEPLIDKEILQATGYWQPQLLDKVKESDVLLFLLSSEALSSANCLEEFNCAVDNSKTLILAKGQVGNLQMPEYFTRIDWVNFVEDDFKGDPYQRLFIALRSPFQLNPALHKLPINSQPNAYQRALALSERLLYWVDESLSQGNYQEDLRTNFIRLFTLTEVIRDDTALTVHIQHIARFLDKGEIEKSLDSRKKAIGRIQELSNLVNS